MGLAICETCNGIRTTRRGSFLIAAGNPSQGLRELYKMDGCCRLTRTGPGWEAEHWLSRSVRVESPRSDQGSDSGADRVGSHSSLRLSTNTF